MSGRFLKSEPDFNLTYTFNSVVSQPFLTRAPPGQLKSGDSIDPDFQCNHDDKMAIKTDQSLLNDNKQENIQYPQNKIVINQCRMK